MDIYIKNYKFISLGYNCLIKKYMNDIFISQETNLFDYLGTSMWSINELFLNDFNNLFNIEDYKKYKLLNKSKYNIIINEKYYIRFPHDFDNKKNNKLVLNNNQNNTHIINRTTINEDIMITLKNNFPNFINTLKRRIERLKKILSDEKNILFLRFEEDNDDRIIYDIYKDKLIKTELENIIEFSNIIKKIYPKLNFKIIYISKINDNNYDEINNIIILKNNFDNFNWDNCSNKFSKIFDSNKDFLSNILKV